MMSKLRYVRCLRTSTDEEKEYNLITKGEVYTVLEYKNKLYRIKNDDGSTILWYEECLFQELTEYNNELSIIEASNMPYGTEFKVKIDCYYKHDDACRIRDNTNLIAVNTQSGIRFKEYSDIEKASKTLVNAKFIPIQKSVSTVEAFKSLEEGKIIESLCTHEKYKKDYRQLSIVVEGFGYEECENISSAEILDDWIIIDTKEYIRS